MNDNKINGMSSDSELDAILEEVRRGTLTADSAEEESEPSKTWSLDDIDRLIAQTNGEEYVPKKKEPLTPAEDFKRILRRSEMDTEMFTVKPLSEPRHILRIGGGRGRGSGDLLQLRQR